MFRIGICDDDAVWRKEAVRLCEEYMTQNNLEFEIIEFLSGEEVLEYAGEKICLLLLDIEMSGLDGIEVMRRLENSPLIWRLVFVSSHSECVWESFGLKTLDFATKPLNYSKFEKWMNIAVRENKDRKLVELDAVEGHIYRYADEIHYIISQGNYSLLYDGTSEILVNGVLKHWQDILKDSNIFRIHKCFLVNPIHIKKLEYDKVIMQDGREMNIGRVYREKTRELYKIFVREIAMGRR